MAEAEILIGRIEHRGWELESFYENCFALYIEGNLIAAEKLVECASGYKPQCRKMGKEFSSLLLSRGVTEYVLSNGERLRSETKKRIGCIEMPEDGVDILRQNIKANLATRVEAVA